MVGEKASHEEHFRLVYLLTTSSKIRLRSIRQVGIVAAAIGPQRTRDELLPFLIGMW